MNSLAALSLRSSSTSSSSCKLPTPLVPIPTEPIVGSRDFYHVNIIVSGALALFSTLVVLALIWRHATNMSRPREQLYIIRICLLLPIFAIALWVGVYIPRVYVYLYSIVVFCEPVTLTCFFLFICETLAAPVSTTSPETETEPESSSSLLSAPSRRTIFLSPLATRAKRLGVPLTDRRVFNTYRLSWLGVAQCIPIAWAVALAAIVTEALGVYCLTAHDGHHAHLILIVFKTISTITALVAVLRTTLLVRAEVKRHRAIAKLWAFKALIFLQVAQDFIFSIVNSKPTRTITESKTVSQIDFLTGIPSLVVEVELVIFALFFHYAYSVSMYQLSDEQKRAGERYARFGWREILKVFDIRDVFVFIRLAFRARREVVKYEIECYGRPAAPISEQQPRARRGSISSTQESTTDRKLPHEEMGQASIQEK